MSKKPGELRYAPPIPWHRRARVRRYAILGIVLVTLALSALWAPPLWEHAKILYWQRQCMTYRPPADGQAVFQASGGASGTVSHAAQAWSELYALLSPPGKNPASTLFLGPVRNGDGEPRLLAVELYEQRGEHGAVRGVRADVVRPGLIDKPVLLQSDFRLLRADQATGTIEFAAGQVDRDDPSRVTISGKFNDQPIRVNVWVRKQDRLVVEVDQLTAPVTQPSP